MVGSVILFLFIAQIDPEAQGVGTTIQSRPDVTGGLCRLLGASLILATLFERKMNKNISIDYFRYLKKSQIHDFS